MMVMDASSRTVWKMVMCILSRMVWMMVMCALTRFVDGVVVVVSQHVLVAPALPSGMFWPWGYDLPVLATASRCLARRMPPYPFLDLDS